MNTSADGLAKVISINEFFDCDKLKNMIREKKKMSIGQRWNRWLKRCISDTRLKIVSDLNQYNNFK